MSRSLTYNALTLRVKASGESNRDIWFLSAEEGIFKATVFGGPKSRLKAHAAPFCQGRLWIYHDPAKDSRKVTDFDVQSWRPGLREMYERTIAANCVAETVLATHAGGGAWSAAFKLLSSVLDCLDTADEKICPRILLHFFWSWTGFLGVKPDPGCCTHCACEVPGDALLWYKPDEGIFLCQKCRVSGYAGGPDITAGAGARRWLLAVDNLEPKDALRYSLDSVSFQQARALALSVLTESLGKRLSLWDY